MTRVTSFGQSPDTILPAEFNNIEDDYEELFQEYHTIHSVAGGNLQDWSNSFWYLLTPYEGTVTQISVSQQNTFGQFPHACGLFYWDANDYADLAAGAGGPRAIKLRMRTTVACLGTVGPACTYTFGLRTIQALNGGTLNNRLSMSFPSTNVSGITTSHVTNGANTVIQIVSELADATVLAPNFYAVVVSLSTLPNTSADVYCWVDLSVAVP